MTKIGVIGGGPWGQNHIKTLAQMGALAGVAEMDAPRRAQLSATYPQVQFFANYQELLPLCQGVVIATPAPTHFEIAKDCLSKNIPLLIEKPMTLNSVEAKELGKIAEQKNVLIMVGHLLLFQPAIGFIKEYLDSGKLGEIYSANLNRLNLGRVRKVENALWSLGVHDVAVGLYLLGLNPLNIKGWGQAALQKGVQDDFRVHVECEKAVNLHIHSSWFWPVLKREMTIIGKLGALHFDEVNQRVTLHKSTINDNLETQNLGSEVLFESKAEPLKIELNHFIECIEKKSKCISDHKLGINVVNVLERAHG